MLAVIMASAGWMIGMYLVSRGLFNRLLVDLLEKNEESRSRNKEEVNSGLKDMLENNKDLIKQITDDLKAQLKNSQDDVKVMRQQNSVIREHLQTSIKATENLQTSTDSLRNLLSNNRLRGNWGEQVAEDLLLASGFVEGINYTKQTNTAAGRPDFTFLLPDGTKLNIDAKFPFDDLIAYQEAKTDAQRKTHLADFERAVKIKVTAITAKDYIDPGNQTCDFVVMFIPNEMIFSFIYERLPKLNDYCNKRKVILAGPYGFTALIRLVLQAYKNFRYEQGLQDIIGLVGKFQVEYEKFGQEMERLGRALDTAQETFSKAEGTRSRSLSRVVDKISEHSSSQLKSPDETSKLVGITGEVTEFEEVEL